jgi:glucosamine kinase
MADETLTVGVDGGGTRTRCIAIDAAGHFAAAGDSGPLMGLYAGQEAAERALEESLGRCIGCLTQRAESVGQIGICVPICDRERLTAVVERHIPTACVHWVESEAVACLAAAGVPRGLVILSGTGSFADAVDGGAVVGHAGGFGPLLGDDGSGYAIGLDALRAAVRASQGRSAPTDLEQAACGHFDVDELWGLVDHLYGERLPRERIAAFAPTVVRLADGGDEAAASVLHRAADDLADMSRAAVRQAEWDEEPVSAVLCGGVLDGSQTLRGLVTRRLADLVPRAEPIASRFAPVVGAALLALGQPGAGRADTAANLNDTLPDDYKTSK